MPITEEMRTELTQLPLRERQELLVAIEQSILAEQHAISPDDESHQLSTCRERLARFDAGETTALSADAVRRQLFGQA